MSEPALSPDERGPIVRDSLGVGIATGLYGTSFGAVSVASGLDVAQTCALSLLVFTGASQFALVGVLGAGGSAVSAVLTAALLGTRNTLYGLRLAPLLAWRGVRRLGAAHLVIDESTAMAVTRGSTEAARTGFTWTGGSVFVLWNLFTLLGAIGGTVLGDPRTYGLDAAVGAAFLALLWPRLREPGGLALALAAATVALLVVPLAPAGVPVLAAGGTALLAGLLARGRSRPERAA